MLHVVCRIGPDAYALPAEVVEKVLPFAALKPLPGAVRGVIGVLNFQGEPVPVVDLDLLFHGTPAPEAFGTRIILCRMPSLVSGRLGLLVGMIEGVSTVPEASFVPAGAAVDPALGGVSSAGGSFIQRIELPGVLPDDIRAGLDWREAEEAA